MNLARWAFELVNTYLFMNFFIKTELYFKMLYFLFSHSMIFIFDYLYNEHIHIVLLYIGISLFIL